jgi:hypothetical protein
VFVLLSVLEACTLIATRLLPPLGTAFSMPPAAGAATVENRPEAPVVMVD